MATAAGSAGAASAVAFAGALAAADMSLVGCMVAFPEAEDSDFGARRAALDMPTVILRGGGAIG